VVRENPSLIGRVRRFQRDHVAAAAVAFQRGFMIFDQSHDDIAVVGGRLFPDHHDVAIVDPGLDHRVALDLQRVMLALARQHRSGHSDVV
jgi:hypothetical protein